tara:strand:- start:464 stop:742 length:279 start_codon:yes stop_codon:yes gene_type:complete
MDYWKKVKRRIAKLATKALNDKPDWQPPKGAIYLKDVEDGQLIQVYNSETQAIVLNKTPSSVSVYVTSHRSKDPFYAGEQRWGLETEVQVVE